MYRSKLIKYVLSHFLTEYPFLKFNATTGRVAAAVIEYDAKQIFSFSHAEMQNFEQVV